jgi:hypothetical protein
MVVAGTELPVASSPTLSARTADQCFGAFLRVATGIAHRAVIAMTFFGAILHANWCSLWASLSTFAGIAFAWRRLFLIDRILEDILLVGHDIYGSIDLIRVVSRILLTLILDRIIVSVGVLGCVGVRVDRPITGGIPGIASCHVFRPLGKVVCTAPKTQAQSDPTDPAPILNGASLVHDSVLR